MAENLTMNQLKDVFSFPFREEGWEGKLAVAAALLLFGFVPFIPFIFISGYVALIMRNVVETDELSLPAWGDLSSIFRHGLRLFGVGFVYSLPVLILFFVGYGSIFLPVLTMELGILPEGTGFVSVLGGYAVGFMLMGIAGVVSFAMAVFLPAASTHTVVEEDFGAAFRFKEWWPIFRANWEGFLISFLLLFGGGMIAYYASQILVFTIVLCCLYPLVISALGAYLMVVGSVLFARAYREGRDEVEAAAAK